MERFSSAMLEVSLRRAAQRMRNVLIEARDLPFSQVAAQLSSDDGLLIGTLAVYRMSEVEARLNAAGVRPERVPHEDDSR
ncbi:hypothetical protein CDN98_17065 [Roseateles terrae]|nr:hypothetical protein CDN98_17065 [Roseateles terrae]